jgi:hypothetical protein
MYKLSEFMFIDISGMKFEETKLVFTNTGIINVFAIKNNKTLRETLLHRRYIKFSNVFYGLYKAYLDWKLGDFLMELKLSGDDHYKLFLNKYGDETYSIFYIDDPKFLNQKGIYSYFVDDELMYIGRCRDSFRKRINQGYGKIYPKNCYLDGQATNCHLNSRITQNMENVRLYIHTMEDIVEIVKIEKDIIFELEPAWNIQK